MNKEEKYKELLRKANNVIEELMSPYAESYSCDICAKHEICSGDCCGKDKPEWEHAAEVKELIEEKEEIL